VLILTLYDYSQHRHFSPEDRTVFLCFWNVGIHPPVYTAPQPGIVMLSVTAQVYCNCCRTTMSALLTVLRRSGDFKTLYLLHRNRSADVRHTVSKEISSAAGRKWFERTNGNHEASQPVPSPRLEPSDFRVGYSLEDYSCANLSASVIYTHVYGCK
jgi:hypothetical protein